MHHKEIFDDRKERIRLLPCTVTLRFKPDILFSSLKSFKSPSKDTPRERGRLNLMNQPCVKIRFKIKVQNEAYSYSIMFFAYAKQIVL